MRSETIGRRRTDSSGYTKEKRAIVNRYSYSVEKTAEALVGSRAQYRGLPATARAELRLHARELMATGQDYTKSFNKMKTDPTGFVYLITNSAWPGFVKIGMAVSPHGRLNNYQTSSPYRDYELHHFVWVNDRRKAEAEIHDWLNYRRYNGEWFKIDIGEARMVLEVIKDFYEQAP